MKKYSLLSLLLLFFFVACGASSNSPEEATSTPDGPALEQAPESSQPEAEEDVFPRVTITPMADSEEGDAYPANVVPTPSPLPEGYPAPVVPLPPDPYPAEGSTVWVIKPAGEQCAESLDFATEQDAVASLEAGGIETFNSRTVEFMVAASCGSPTSTHYAVEIAAADQEAAEALEWRVIPVEELDG